jgi:hypothetical protein
MTLNASSYPNSNFGRIDLQCQWHRRVNILDFGNINFSNMPRQALDSMFDVWFALANCPCTVKQVINAFRV